MNKLMLNLILIAAIAMFLFIGPYTTYGYTMNLNLSKIMYNTHNYYTSSPTTQSVPSNFKYGYTAISYVDYNGAPSISGYTSLITQATGDYESGFGPNAYDMQTEVYLSNPNNAITMNGNNGGTVNEVATTIPFQTIYTLNNSNPTSIQIPINQTSLIIILTAGMYQAEYGGTYYIPSALNCTDDFAPGGNFQTDAYLCYSTTSSPTNVELTANTSADGYSTNIAILKANYVPATANSLTYRNSFFKEVGLPSNTDWAVDYGGKLLMSTKPTINYSVEVSSSNSSVPLPFVVGTVVFVNETFLPHNETGYLLPGQNYTINFTPEFYLKDNWTSFNDINNYTASMFKELAEMNLTLKNMSEADNISFTKMSSMLSNVTNSLSKLQNAQKNYTYYISKLLSESAASLNYTIRFEYGGKLDNISAGMNNLTINVGNLGKLLNKSEGLYNRTLAAVNSSMSSNFANINKSLSKIYNYLPELYTSLKLSDSNDTSLVNSTLNSLDGAIEELSMEMLSMENNSNYLVSSNGDANGRIDNLSQAISKLSNQFSSFKACNNYYYVSNYTLAESIEGTVASDLNYLIKNISGTVDHASVYVGAGPKNDSSAGLASPSFTMSNLSMLENISQHGNKTVYYLSAGPKQGGTLTLSCGGNLDVLKFSAAAGPAQSSGGIINSIDYPFVRIYSAISSFVGSIANYLYGL
ncbi:MAG: hypothetical protein QXJ12_01850 [Candidatus Parvarchaeota archaeon]|nr:hypothetical protein [Candidatus Parvarchaeota archaeon]